MKCAWFLQSGLPLPLSRLPFPILNFPSSVFAFRFQFSVSILHIRFQFPDPFFSFHLSNFVFLFFILDLGFQISGFSFRTSVYSLQL